MNPDKFNKTGGSALHSESGVTVRDYFAAAALTGLAKMSYNVTATALATEAFKLADAMLEARR